MLDEIAKIILFLIMSFGCWVLLFVSSPYDPNKSKAKYVTVRNKTLAKLLIPKRNPWLKYVKVKDRNKVYLPSFVGYICLSLIWGVSLVLFFLPEIPCKPVIIPAGRRRAFTVYTLNEKIPLSSIFILLLIILLYMIIPAFIGFFTKKDEKIRLSTKIGFFFIIALLLFGIIYLIINLI